MLAVHAALILATAVPAAAPAQAPRLAEARPVRDSARVREEARRAQVQFERVRRMNLPWTWGSWGGRCDEVVGRMCMRYDEGDWVPEPEPPSIVQARDDFLGELAGFGELYPGDGWILGQRIRYLAEAGRWDEAVEAAGSCRSPDPGWCPALDGLALHGAERYREAERAFDRALSAMDPAQAGRWRDPSVLLADRGDVLREEEGVLPPDVRVERTWALADPLFLVQGNDRLTEHYARFVMASLRAGARTTYGMSWGRDLEELLVRYGWEVGWERTRPGPGETRASGVVGHHHPESLTYVPPPAFVAVPPESDPAEWSLDPPAPRSAYAPAYAPEMSLADVQVARFRRGDRVRVVAAYRMLPPERTDERLRSNPDAWVRDLAPDTPVRAGLFLLADGAGAPLAVEADGGPRGSLDLTAPAGSYLVSVEAWSPDRAVASRARMGLEADTVPPDVPVLSDALLLDGSLGLPRTLDQAVPRAWPGTLLPAGHPLAVAWEVSGMGPGQEKLDYRITVERTDRSLIQKAGSLFGLLGSDPELRLAWSEETPGGVRRHFRATDLDLPHLDPGRYRLTLEVSLPGRSTMVTRRTLTVERPATAGP